MRPRRSRFTRIYKRITRRGTRRRQWQEIVHLRPHGSLGHPSVASPVRACTTYEYGQSTQPRLEFAVEPTAFDSYGTTQFADEAPFAAPQEDASLAGGLGVVLLTISLFLLACVYAAVSGYMHSSNDTFAAFALLGGIGSLVAAGFGIALASSPTRRKYSGRFLAVCVTFLASLLAVLLLVATRG